MTRAYGDLDPAPHQELRELSSGPTADVLLDTLGAFLTSCADMRVQIVSGAANRDGESVGAACHRLKSACRWAGATALGELCEQLDQSRNAEDFDAVLGAVDELLRGIDATAVAVEAVVRAEGGTP